MKQDKEDWVNKKWRPAMGWMYMAVCIFDFVLFPIMFTIVQFWEKDISNDAFRQWQPLTLIGGGLFHMAMGVVLGITSWSRGQEKINGVINQPTLNTNASYEYSAPQGIPRTQIVDTFQPIRSGYKGKKAPPEPDYPEI